VSKFDQAVLLDLQYLPGVWYFAKLANHPVALLEQHEHYHKGSYRNRCHIASVNGIQRLTVPLCKGKNQQLPIREVRIAYHEPWQAQHWQAIQSAYGRSPFFEFYADEFSSLFRKKYEWLWDWNYDLLILLVKFIGLKTDLRLTGAYETEPAGIIDLRDKIHPKRTVPDPDFQPVHYGQVFEDRLGFLGNLSAIDLVFCAGPSAIKILKSSIH
jgi:hypothetical protein